GVQLRERKKMGHRFDMIFCENRVGHDETIEYGASEVGGLYDGNQGTKRLEEGCKKLPKCLKDMLNNLLLKKDNKSRKTHISNDISGFGSTVLPAIYSAWIAKEVVKDVQGALISSVGCDDVGDSSWLDNYWDEEGKDDIVPETLTSSGLRIGKKFKKA
ncbi:uncharacterized protein EV154DRAFT_410522, partial [Mucor mucedo]|uniref:uncharacterized protein n=1 Tax=Mucor mucedo TaxID=29922 RepID=UPI00221FC19B